MYVIEVTSGEMIGYYDEDDIAECRRCHAAPEYKWSSDNSQVTATRKSLTGGSDEEETVETEPESKPKSNKRKWLFGLGASTVLAGVIAYVFKNN